MNKRVLGLLILVSLVCCVILFPVSTQSQENSVLYPGGFNWPVPYIAKTAGPAIVGIANLAQNYFSAGLVEQSSGSGVIIDAANGYIVTNNHVVAGAQALEVSLADGRVVRGRVLGRDARSDLAVVKVDVDNLTAVPLGDSGSLEVGELVVAIGNPLNKAFARTVTHGIISALDRTLDFGDVKLNVLQTDAPINPGNSGGGLFNIRAELVGVNSAKIAVAGVEGMGFAIPVNVARPIINELISQGYVSRAWLGIEGITVTEAAAAYYDIPRGVFLKRVISGGPAAKAGMRPGDIIMRIDGQAVLSGNQLAERVAAHKVGDNIPVVIYRNGQEITVPVILQQLPVNQ